MYTNQTGSQYSSPFMSTAELYSNPASLNSKTLADAYTNLEYLRNNMQQTRQPQQKNTVFTDINKELEGLSNDEKEFIMASNEYKLADSKYQNEFSQFLISKFSDEFLQGHQRTMEELLLVIRTKKEQYKNKFADDVAEIREYNKNLESRNSELAKSNMELQKQLENIKAKLEANL